MILFRNYNANEKVYKKIPSFIFLEKGVQVKDFFKRNNSLIK